MLVLQKEDTLFKTLSREILSDNSAPGSSGIAHLETHLGIYLLAFLPQEFLLGLDQ
jgi:hypothetical protein